MHSRETASGRNIELSAGHQILDDQCEAKIASILHERQEPAVARHRRLELGASFVGMQQLDFAARQRQFHQPQLLWPIEHHEQQLTAVRLREDRIAFHSAIGRQANRLNCDYELTETKSHKRREQHTPTKHSSVFSHATAS